MLVLLLAIALIALTIAALLLLGVVAAIVTGIVVLNLSALLLGLRSRRPYPPRAEGERWRPSHFRRPPLAPSLEPPSEHDEHPQLTIHRR